VPLFPTRAPRADEPDRLLFIVLPPYGIGDRQKSTQDR